LLSSFFFPFLLKKCNYWSRVILVECVSSLFLTSCYFPLHRKGSIAVSVDYTAVSGEKQGKKDKNNFFFAKSNVFMVRGAKGVFWGII